MGRPRKTLKQKKDDVVKVKSPNKMSKVKSEPLKPEKTEVFAVSVLESPLLLCRSCRDSFETAEVSIGKHLLLSISTT